ncbi:MAG TPA: NAD(P)H-dependent glycerol-3-phosphate dehydrogenase [Alphaproteobacteria bacterium]|nr:NAD(P)H-dependent glycerol-3-phosphate dehydrogenase [Alphaproteobacteria bacterium]
MAKTYQHFGIIGGGAWGTALALALLRAGRQVTLWAYEKDVAEAINTKHENPTYLKGIKLSPGIEATSKLEDIAKCDAWILVSPAQHLRGICKQLHKVAGKSAAPAIIASKGIENSTSALLSSVVTAELPGHPVAVLSGPSFAIEVAKALPAALTLAVKDKVLGTDLLQAMATPQLRLYLSDDIVGAQIGGAVKNVLAVACGIVTGRHLGDNARAAIITRGLAELMRLGVAMSGRAETLMGLSGLGDLVLTCSSPQSRNMSLGIELGKGKSLEEILASRSSVTEGVTTAAAALALAQKHKIEMPIVAAVDAVLNHKANIETVIAGLLARPLKQETH